MPPRKSAASSRSAARQVNLDLPADVAEWLAAQPGGGAALIEHLIRERMQGPEVWSRRLLGAFSSALREAEPALLRHLARELWAGGPAHESAPAAPAPPSPEALRSVQDLEAVDPQVAQRAAALARYPQLIDAVARGLVTIDRAEAMAEEADSRS
ncbi:MAG: hypothetical protein HY319_01735 [Armatimonadetes bacterium]|nr:hypothetical protein [Armatimonadota bacterium]